MNVKGILFDKDGTLLDFDGFWTVAASTAADKIIAAVGAEPGIKNCLMKAIGVNNSTASITGSLCCGTYGDISRDIGCVLDSKGYCIEKDKLLQITVNAFHSSLCEGKIMPACAGLKETLAELCRRGIKCAVLTSDDIDGTEHCLNKLGIRQYFNKIYTDDGILRPKPFPDAVNRFCCDEQLGKEEVILVGDTLIDMLCAENSGIKAVGVAKNSDNKKLLMEKTDIVLEDISKIFEVIDKR